MELSCNAFFADEDWPLLRNPGHRSVRNGRGVPLADGRVSRSNEAGGERAIDGRIGQRSKDKAGSNRRGPAGHIDQGHALRRIGPKGEITIVALALDVYNARVYHDMLEARGYRPVSTHDFEGWPNVLAACDPDLILIDLCSAEHPSTDVARAIMRDARYASVPVITVTDAHKSGDLNDPARIIVDCDGRIFKPISVDGFYRPIEAILKRTAVRRTFQQ